MSAAADFGPGPALDPPDNDIPDVFIPVHASEIAELISDLENGLEVPEFDLFAVADGVRDTLQRILEEGEHIKR